MKKSRVLISILNWNGGHEIIDCIHSIKKSTYTDYKLLIIDNASTDNSIQIIESQFPEIYIIRNQTNLGFTGGQNQGIRHAIKLDYELIWILNSDTIVNASTLHELINALDTGCQVGMVSPVIKNDDENNSIQFCGCAINYESFGFNIFPSINEALAAQNSSPEYFCLWGTAILTRSSLMKRLSGFDEKFFAYYEDLDLSIRVIRTGFTNKIVSNATIIHYGSNNSEKRPPHYTYYNIRNRYIFWNKTLIGYQKKYYFFREFLAGAIIHASTWRERSNKAKENAALLAIWDGLILHGGAWDITRTAPKILNLLLLYPYFISRLLRFNFFKHRSK